MAKKKINNQVENNEAAGLSPALAALIKENMKQDEFLRYGEGDTELVIRVSHTVSVGRKAEAVRLATDMLFRSDKTDILAYMPAFSDFALRYGILTAYTSFDTPKDLHNAWEAILYTPIFDDTVEILGEEIVLDFVANFNELVEARKQEIIHSINWNKMLDKVLEKAERLPGDLDESLKNIDLKGLNVEKILESIKGIQGAEGFNLDGIVDMFKKNK